MMTDFCIYFVIYSFLGWIYESLFYSAQLRKPVNTGFLRGCFCPIYGLACVFNVAVLYKIENNAYVFLISMIGISAIEYTVSYVLEALFDKRWWDYTSWPCNLNGRISLISSLGFGIMSVLQLRVLHPFIESGIRELSQNTKTAFIAVAAICVIADLFMTVKGINKEEERYRFLDEEAELVRQTCDLLCSATERINDMREFIRDRFTK